MVVWVPILRLNSTWVVLSVVLAPSFVKNRPRGKWGRRTYLSRKMEELRQGRGGMCERCGSRMYLEFAHIRDTGLHGHSRGQWTRIKDIIRYPFCYMLLCVDCHAYMDQQYGRVRYDREMMAQVLP